MEEVIVEKKETKRDTNMELLRIVAMFMVITLHCLGNGQLLGNTSISVYNIIAIRLLDFFSLTANAIFLIISGYYSIDKKFNIKRILTLWGKTIFYSILIYIICNFFNLNIQSVTSASFVSFFPILSGEYWFINAYIVLYFLSPILNVMLNKLNRKQFKYLLITSIIMIGIIRVIFNPGGTLTGTMLPVILVYMIGAYMRKFVTIEPKKYCFVKYILFTAIATFIFITLSIILKLIDNNIIYSLIKRIISEFREYSNILILIMTILIFYKFKTITIKSKFISKIITIISPSVFSIYLIHQSINIRDTMWLKMGIMQYADSWFMLPYILIMIAMVFIICLCIDLIRRVSYYGIKKVPIITKILEKINEKLYKINSRINNYIAD